MAQTRADTVQQEREVVYAALQYYSRPKPIRTISGFLELISRFEFDFSSLRNFFVRFEFLVCSKFNHTQCSRTCACAVACLRPHNSISNVVVSLTIHDNINIYVYLFIYVKDVATT